jgi:predicted transcriptional regulator
MTQDQITIIQQIGLGILEAIESCGNIGAPAGALYAALMAKGASLNQFNSIMGTLTTKGMATEEGNCYSITDQGRVFMRKLQAKFG